MLERAHVAVDLREVLGELRFASGQVLARGRDDRRVEAEPRRDLEGEAAARRAVHQLVGRRERLGVESERGARYTLGRRRVGLQRVVMARRDDRRAARLEVIDDGDAQRASFDRICARADLVEEDERRRREAAVHRGNVGDVRRERAEARFDRLLVADIGEERSEDRQPRSVRGWNPQTGLRHQREQPRRFERYGLPAGVRTGDQQHRCRRNDLDGHRHRRLARSRRPAPRNHQRVPRGLELEGAVGRQRRLDAVDRFGIPRPRLEHVEFGGDVDRPSEIGGAGAKRVGQRQQDLSDFLRFLLLERDDVVVDFNGAERLEEHTRAARR